MSKDRKILIRAIIIEDEPKNAEGLRRMLEMYCPNVELVGQAQTLADARLMILQEDPKLIFLDISLPDGMGYSLLEDQMMKDREVVFTTAFDQYALKAFQLGAIHYLLKPINPTDLKEAVARVLHHRSKPNDGTQLISRPIPGDPYHSGLRKLAIPTLEGFEVIDLDEINYFESSGPYTKVHVANKPEIMVSRTLIKFETLLVDHGFIRTHDRFLVNMSKITRYIRGRGGQVVLLDGETIPISQRRKDHFLNIFKDYLA